MRDHDLIVSDPAVLDGQPRIKGTRLTVRRVLSIVGQYQSRDDLRADYPQLTDEAIQQALDYAAATLEDRVIPLRPAS